MRLTEVAPEPERARPGQPRARTAADVARSRATVEMIERHGRSLRQTARRYSLCADDAEDAYQRALEIALTKAPTEQPRDLIRWTQTVTKHEALAIRRKRERMLGTPKPQLSGEGADVDWVALIPAAEDGPELRVERRERIARSREALQALKPAELRALTLLAEGYSYAEIAEITGFSPTKVNRCLAEGRERFRALVSRSEDGSRCLEMGALLSAFCDGETGAKETAAVREHLRACARCRAALRAYRAAPGAAAALAPLPPSRSLLERAHEFLAELHSRLPGGGAKATGATAQVAAGGGTPGAGLLITKALVVCAAAAGGAGALAAAGIAPSPLDVAPLAVKAPRLVPGWGPARTESAAGVRRVRKYRHSAPAPVRPPAQRRRAALDAPSESPPPLAQPEAASAEYTAPEYTAPSPPPAPPPPSAEPSSTAGGSAAGEFGP